MAIAYLNLRPDEFYEMRVGTFYTALHVWLNHQKEMQQFTANLVRMQTADLLNIQIQKKDRLKHPSELWRFPWDDENEEETKPVTSEDIKRHNEEILKKFQKNGD